MWSTVNIKEGQGKYSVWLPGYQVIRWSSDKRVCSTIWQAGKVAGCERVASLTTCHTANLCHPSILLLTPLKGPSSATPPPFGPWPPVPYLGVLARGCGRSAPDPPPAPSLKRAGPGGPASELPPTAHCHHHQSSSAEIFLCQRF